MSLIPFSVANQPQDKLSKPVRGEVVDNNDPMMLGRVKIKIPGMVEGDNDSLPWSYPERPTTGQGGTNKAAAHHVPRIGSELQIEFQQGNVYTPFHTGYWHSDQNQDMSNFKDNYPNKIGTQTTTGNSLVHDVQTHDLTYTHRAVDDDQSSDAQPEGDDGSNPTGGTSFSVSRRLKDSSSGSGSSGSSSSSGPGTMPAKMSMNIDKDGSMTLMSQKDLTATISGNVNITATGTTTIKGSKINLN